MIKYLKFSIPKYALVSQYSSIFIMNTKRDTSQHRFRDNKFNNHQYYSYQMQKLFFQMTIKILIFILAIVLLSSCGKQDKVEIIKEPCKTHIRSIGLFSRDNLSKSSADRIKHFVDSMIVEVGDLTCDYAWVSIHSSLSHYHFLNNNFEQAILHADSSTYYGHKAEDPLSIKNGLKRKASILREQGKLKEAILCLDEAHKVPCYNEEEICNEHKVQIHMRYSTLYSLLKNYSKTEYHLLQADSIQGSFANSYKDSTLLVTINVNLGDLLNKTDQNIKALKYTKRALELCPAKAKFYRSAIYINMAGQWNQLNNLDSAKYYFDQAIKIEPPLAHQVYLYYGLGEVAHKQKDYTEAIQNFKRSIKMAEGSKSTHLVLQGLSGLGGAYYEDGQYDNAINTISKSEDVSYSSVSVDKETNLTLLKYKILSQFQKSGHQNWSILVDSLISLKDSIYNKKNLDKVESITHKFSSRLLQDSLQIYQLTNDNQALAITSQRRGISFLLLTGAVLLFLLIRLSKRFKQKIEENEGLQFTNEELQNLNINLQSKLANSESNEEELQITTVNKTYFVKPSKIISVHAEDGGVRIITLDTSLWTKLTLTKFLAQLPQDQFFRIHRSSIVNIQHVKMINTSYLQMTNETTHNIGRSFKKEVMNAINKKNS